MNIALVTAEAAPFAKAGGLADIAQSLPVEWHELGQNPIVIMPKYGSLDIHKYGFKPTNLTINVPMSWWTEYGYLWYGTFPGTDVPVYLIENADYFNREGIYGYPDEYPDNDRRYIFFSRAIFEVLKAINFYPDIIHAHDFHTAFSMAFLKTHYRHDPRFSSCAGVFTIHNLAYQGWFNPQRAMDLSGFGMSQFFPGSNFEHLGTVNAMKVGIMFADKITTVSPNYANEIRMPYFSEGMQIPLNERGADLVGILNGVLYSEWSPENDNLIYQKYDSENLKIKRENKLAFLAEHGIGIGDFPDIPLIGMVTRLAEQKGVDILMWKMEEFLSQNSVRFTLLGSGESRYVDYFKYLEWKYPGRALIHIGYDNQMSHKILASSDFLMMPSRFEPCGLTQMYALKYGTIPIVRMTGGLVDSVFEYNYEYASGTGFTFWQYNADDLAYSIRRAISVYNNEPHWTLIRKNAMNQDFSSRRSALEYLKIFNWALEKVR